MEKTDKQSMEIRDINIIDYENLSTEEKMNGTVYRIIQDDCEHEIQGNLAAAYKFKNRLFGFPF